MKPLRAEMIQAYIGQLRASLGAMKPIDETELRELFGKNDYTGMVKIIRDKLGLDLRVRVGIVNDGGPVGAPAWITAPKPMPRFGTAAFRQTLVTVFLRKTFLSNHTFEQVVIAIAHELSHIVLFGTNHRLQDREEAVDLTAMLLGYRDLYVAGSFCEVGPTSFWGRINPLSEKRVAGVQGRIYRTLGYLTPEEVRYAAVILGKPLEDFRTAPLRPKGSVLSEIPPLVYSVIAVGFICLAVLVQGPTTPAPQQTLMCANQPQPNHGVYARYDYSPNVAPLTIKTERGSNYFVKIEDSNSGRLVRSFYIIGGLILESKIPAGSFVLKYATGNSWCGDKELFGASTETSKADQIFQFEIDQGYTIELIKRQKGNLPTRKISRESF